MTPDCRVTRVETHLVGARWCNWVFAQVHTDDGIKGIGEGTCEWQAKAVEAAILQLAERYLIGQPAFGIERLWQAMFRNEFARGGPILNSAIGAIEIALWDIVGKALGQPVHALLGGRVHEHLPAYANAWYGTGATPAEIDAT
jgi:galactonate dehydratase